MSNYSKKKCCVGEADGGISLFTGRNFSFSSHEGQKKNDSPPLDVIVIRRDELGSCDLTSSSMIRNLPSRGSSIKPKLSPVSVETSTSSFQLKPRNSLKSVGSQGRKRSSSSISPGMFSTEDSINAVVARGVTDTARSLKGFPIQDSSHYLESPGGISNTLSNLNALSLRTPEQARISLLNVRAAGCPSPPAFLDDGLADKRLFAKTSFTRYSGSPAVETLPCSPLDSATRLGLPVTMGSPDGSAFSSSKPTSFTFLGHDGRNFSTPTSIDHTMFLQAKTFPAGVGERDNVMFSQSNGRGSIRSIDSFSTIEEHRSDKMRKSSGTNRNSERSPGQILPQVYLTPRSSGIHISSLTRFPSPPRNDELSISFFSSTSERKGTSQMKDINDEKDLHQEARPHSLTQDTACSTLGEEHDLIYLPGISRGVKHESSVEYSLERCKTGCQLALGSRPRSRSLLNRSLSNSSILAELSSADYGRDGNESLSFSDEEEAFLLVAPSSLRSNKVEEDLSHKRVRDSLPQSTYVAPTNTSSEATWTSSTICVESTAAKKDSVGSNQLFPPGGDINDDQLSNTCMFQKREAGNIFLTSRDLVTPPPMRPETLHLTPDF